MKETVTKMLHSGINLKYNVGIRKVNVTNNEVKEEFGNNRVTMNLLTGLVNFVKGDFNAGIKQGGKYIPKYLHVGSGNTPVTVNDVNLANPFDFECPINESTSIDLDTGSDYIAITLGFHINTNDLVNETIREIGLFSESDGTGTKTLLARYVLDEEILKTDTEFLEVKWLLSFRSYHPESNNLLGGSNENNENENSGE